MRSNTPGPVRPSRALMSTLAAALLGAAPAAAQQPFALDEIVFSANPFPAPAGRTGTAITVIDREQIEAAGDTRLADTLARLPGVSVTGFGPTGTTAFLRIRGVPQRFVSVYVDGVPVGDPANPGGDVDFGALTAADIERVELLPGAQSAIYGSGAAAGVVWITTRRPEAEGTEQRFRVTAGSFRTFGATYELARRTERMESALTLSALRSRGFSAASAGTEPDGVRLGRASVSTRYRATDAVTFGVSAFAQRSAGDYDDFNADADNRQTRREIGGRLFAEIGTGAADHVIEFTGYRLARRDETGATGAIDRFSGSRLGLGYSGTMQVAPSLTLAWGADATRERAVSPSVPDGVSSTVVGAFGQALWAPTDRLDVSATARVDRNSDYGTHTTGRLAMAHRTTEALTLRASLGNGFRAPSISQRFGASGGAFPFRGDPDLRPERSRSLDLGADLELAGGVRIGLTGFLLDTSNLIVDTFCPFDPDTFSCVAGTFNSVQNVPGRSRSRGVELAFAAPLGERVTISGNYTWTDARDAGDARLLRVPRHDASLQLDAAVTDRIAATLAVQHVAGRRDFRTDFTQGPIPDYTVVHASARYALTDRAELSLRVENLFDRRYERIAGYAASGRAVHVGLGARF